MKPLHEIDVDYKLATGGSENRRDVNDIQRKFNADVRKQGRMGSNKMICSSNVSADAELHIFTLLCQLHF